MARKTYRLATGHRMVCRHCGQHDESAQCRERLPKARKAKGGTATSVQAVRPSAAVSEPYRGTSEVSLTEEYAARAALGIIGSDQ